ncbi:hypothetical protein DRO61_00900 [Candidatus Bathyarchaeota archaeon]|nr:MAG: hypothetical protein DRO61_00900 [Candidatus Bathyarchaeota archaeon]
MKTIRIQSQIAITVFKPNIVDKKQVIKHQNEVGTVMIKKVIPKWHAKDGRFDIKKGFNVCPAWVLKVSQIKSQMRKGLMSLVASPEEVKKPVKVKKPRAKKAKAKKEVLPD